MVLHLCIILTALYFSIETITESISAEQCERCKEVEVERLHGKHYGAVLYCTVLYCTVLYCTVLYCTVLYCTVLYPVLYCPALCSAVLFFIAIV